RFHSPSLSLPDPLPIFWFHPLTLDPSNSWRTPENLSDHRHVCSIFHFHRASILGASAPIAASDPSNPGIPKAGYVQEPMATILRDRKSTRLNSSHVKIS